MTNCAATRAVPDRSHIIRSGSVLQRVGRAFGNHDVDRLPDLAVIGDREEALQSCIYRSRAAWDLEGGLCVRLEGRSVAEGSESVAALVVLFDVAATVSS